MDEKGAAMSALAQTADAFMDDTQQETKLPPAAMTEDGLRLLGLSRIPRCGDCPRLRALQFAYYTGARHSASWPPPPRGCRQQVCTPLLQRY
jgi:hypothetical protein